jgi:SAM-dependent methyltransferase
MRSAGASESVRAAGERLRALWLRPRVERAYRDVMSSIDRAAFARAFAPGRFPITPGAQVKFLDLERWMRIAVWRYHQYGFHRLSPGTVLDLGSGAGYFLVTCRHFGWTPLGLDLDDPFYGRLTAFFGIPRTTHRIEPGQPLPPLPGPFGAITSFMTWFDRHPDGRPWGAPEWECLLTSAYPLLAPGGRLVVTFNRNDRTGELYPPDVRRAVLAIEGYQARFHGGSMVLVRG